MLLGKKNIFIGARILWVLTLLLLLAVLAGGPGAHLGLWTPLDGFIITLRGAFMGGLTLVALAVIVIIIIAARKKSGGIGKAVMVLVIGLLLAGPVAYLRLSGGGGVPPIHDITTDTVNPPQFVALVGKRGADANSLVYGGEELAAQQKQAYPDIMPIMVSEKPEKAFAKAIEVAGNLGWAVTGVEASGLRFEATDHTFWFAFADDIVLTIVATETGSRIDLRSVSRVGVSDLGANAKRIRAFRFAYGSPS
ncbi:MAG: hypothetical protein COB54_08720 [Alphaproteobacteria bacterium]|nr:MAG: hypothetical protein COB54_08720 [Alphaproteobacteria bacterium]